MPSTIGLIKVASAQEALAEDASNEEEDFEQSNRVLLTGLAKYINDNWEEARRHKEHEKQRFYAASYARRGQYTPSKRAEIQKSGASTEYARIVANKSRVLEAWLKDIFLSGERPWSVSATPSPDLPEGDIERVRQQLGLELASQFASGVSIDQQAAIKLFNDKLDLERMRKKDLAERKAERMEAKIADQLHEGGFEAAFSNFLAYLVTYPAAIFKGPIFRNRDRISWEDVDGTFMPIVKQEIVMEFDAVDPNNFYPAPGIETPQEGYVFEHITLTTSDLYNLIGVDDYEEAEIRAVLDKAGDSGYRWLFHHENEAGSENNRSDVVRTAEHASYIDVLEFHGPIQGKRLVEWGVEGIADEHQYYETTVWYIDGHIIKAVLNDDPMGRREYYKACYEEIPGSFWGWSLYDVLEDVQGVGNAAIRSLVNNMAIASGPQVVANVDRLPPGEDLTNMYPWKIWQVHDGQYTGSGDKAISFDQPNSNVNELLGVLEKFYALADDFSLIPRYMSGSDNVSGPARTATGLSMLLDAANKGLKSVVYGVDVNVMTPMLEQLFHHNMLYADDESIKGDSQIIARGVSSLMQLETMRMRRNEFLQITNNPIDSQIVGMTGRASVLREIAKGLGMDVNKVVPPDSQMGQQQLPTPQGGQGGTPPGPQGSQETLGDGTPVADSASPSGMMR